MRHYEIIFLVHPDQSDQTQSVLAKFSSIIDTSGGIVHRSENIGRRKLSYPIQDQFKASYALMNVECNNEAIEEIESSFQFNDSIIRNLITSTKKAHSELSSLSAQTREEDVESVIEKEEKSLNKKVKKEEEDINDKEQKLTNKDENGKEQEEGEQSDAKVESKNFVDN